MPKTAAQYLVVCVKNNDYPVSIDKRKIYVAVADAKANEHGLVRVIDESGTNYVYPKALFRTIVLPQAIKKPS